MRMNGELMEAGTMNSMLKWPRIRELYLASAAVLIASTLELSAQSTNLPVRPISLQETFAAALSNNLDLRIERLNPLISFEDVEIARAGYDPLLGLTASHAYNVSGGGLDPQSRPIPSSKTYLDSFTSGINGLTPWGMTYNLTGRLNETYGHSSGSTS